MVSFIGTFMFIKIINSIMHTNQKF